MPELRPFLLHNQDLHETERQKPEPSQTMKIVLDYFGQAQKRLDQAKAGSQQSRENTFYFSIQAGHADILSNRAVSGSVSNRIDLEQLNAKMKLCARPASQFIFASTAGKDITYK